MFFQSRIHNERTDDLQMLFSTYAKLDWHARPENKRTINNNKTFECVSQSIPRVENFFNAILLLVQKLESKKKTGPCQCEGLARLLARNLLRLAPLVGFSWAYIETRKCYTCVYPRAAKKMKARAKRVSIVYPKLQRKARGRRTSSWVNLREPILDNSDAAHVRFLRNTNMCRRLMDKLIANWENEKNSLFIQTFFRISRIALVLFICLFFSFENWACNFAIKQTLHFSCFYMTSRTFEWRNIPNEQNSECWIAKEWET